MNVFSQHFAPLKLSLETMRRKETAHEKGQSKAKIDQELLLSLTKLQGEVNGELF
jgi:hypothetical protein